MAELSYKSIFVPGGFPHLTYNPRAERKLESAVAEAKENLCKLLTVTGHTKSGKTVLVRKVFPTAAAIWIDGGQVKTEDDFWDRILEQSDGAQGTDSGVQTEFGAVAGGTATAGASFLAKAEAQTKLDGSFKRAKTVVKRRTVNVRTAALKSVTAAKTPIVVDDFHYIDRDLQGGIVRALKPLIFDGHPVILIAIPHRRYDAMKVEREMTGRISPVDVPSWSELELKFIPTTGFESLNRVLGGTATIRFASEAIGSPHLMQEFCRVLCKHLDIQHSDAQTAVDPAEDQINAVFMEVAESIGRPIFEKLARGPRQRSDRLARILKNGAKVDIYGLVLHALAHLKPALVDIEYEELRTAIKAVSQDEIPQLHEVARVLKHMATIAATDESSTAVIDFDEKEKQLHVTDPFFAFYLRWGNLGK